MSNQEIARDDAVWPPKPEGPKLQNAIAMLDGVIADLGVECPLRLHACRNILRALDAKDAAPPARGEPDPVREVLEHAVALLRYPYNGHHVCRWCSARMTSGESHMDGCWYVNYIARVDAVTEQARAALAGREPEGHKITCCKCGQRKPMSTAFNSTPDPESPPICGDCVYAERATPPPAPLRAVELREVLERASENLGCGDSSCRFIQPTGQHTNGGCRCHKSPGFAGRMAMLWKAIRAALAGAGPDPVREAAQLVVDLEQQTRRASNFYSLRKAIEALDAALAGREPEGREGDRG